MQFIFQQRNYQNTLSKWMKGNRDVSDLIKKYNVSNDERKTPRVNTWRRNNNNVSEKISSQWIDDRYIKKYTEYSEMLALFEDLTKKYPKISER